MSQEERKRATLIHVMSYSRKMVDRLYHLNALAFWSELCRGYDVIFSHGHARSGRCIGTYNLL